MDAREVIAAILQGELDDDVSGVIGACQERQKNTARTNFFLLKTGDKVRLTNLRPKYLIGAEATVVGKKQTRIEVRISPEWLVNHPECRRFQGVVTAAPGMLEKVE